MKVVAIHQPNYLPWLGYFYKIAKCDVFVFLDNVQYTKNSFINRNKIKTSQGTQWLTVGVLSKGNSGQLINEVAINNNVPWGDKHWRSISQAYAHAHCFPELSERLVPIYREPWEYLADLNEILIQVCCDMLGITDVEFVKASKLNVAGAGTDLLINICKEVGADTYLSGPGGAKYMDEGAFESNGIALQYTNFHHPVYSQQWGEFVPDISIIDMLFNEGKGSLQILKGKEVSQTS